MAFTKIPAATNRTLDFTSSGTWTVPSGVYSAEFLVVGAGGGGGAVTVSTAANYGVGGGGGGGSVKYATLPTTPGTSYTITVGAKGVGATGAAGTNGGYSEIVLSGISLVQSYGGQGGQATVANATISPVLNTRTIAGAGGRADEDSTSTLQGSGGGGAFNITPATGNLLFGFEGSNSIASSVTAGPGVSIGGYGIDGYGFGGQGGSINPASTFNTPGAAFNAGVGAFRTTTGATAGGNAGANFGSGGGGACAHTSTTAVAGGNGSDGLVRITYFAQICDCRR